FLAAYPDDPMARRVRAIIAARREAIIWRETYAADTPQAYWSYLRLYPRGPHCADARRRLALRAAAYEPPASFVVVDYDVPPPGLGRASPHRPAGAGFRRGRFFPPSAAAGLFPAAATARAHCASSAAAGL